MKLGKKQFEVATTVAEQLDMDLIFDAIDTFNRVGKIAFKGKDTELEAISEGLIGEIYYKGLKNHQKARPHLYDCLRLAETLYPKNVYGEDWYRNATVQLHEVRQVLDRELSEK